MHAYTIFQMRIALQLSNWFGNQYGNVVMCHRSITDRLKFHRICLRLLMDKALSTVDNMKYKFYDTSRSSNKPYLTSSISSHWKKLSECFDEIQIVSLTIYIISNRNWLQRYLQKCMFAQFPIFFVLNINSVYIDFLHVCQFNCNFHSQSICDLQHTCQFVVK